MPDGLKYSLRGFGLGQVLLAMASFFLPGPRSGAQGADEPPPVAVERDTAGHMAEAQLRLLVTIARFTAWPPEARINGEPLILGLVGPHGFGRQLRDLEHVTIAGRPLELRFFAHAGDIDRCHVLFVAEAEASDLAAILERVDGRPVLTLSGLAGFARSGGMFEFVQEGRQVRFISNPPAIAKAGLQINRGVFRHGSTVTGGGEAKP